LDTAQTDALFVGVRRSGQRKLDFNCGAIECGGSRLAPLERGYGQMVRERAAWFAFYGNLRNIL